jgi:TRAP-type C4-dicarboxylate transport system substrate-binding protein
LPATIRPNSNSLSSALCGRDQVRRRHDGRGCGRTGGGHVGGGDGLLRHDRTPAQTKWDLPAAYPATNFHTENLTQFAKDVDKATGGKLKITVHANASLFKAPEIKRAVQGGQAQIGEILLVNFQNEWQIYGADGLPFLADSYDESKEAVQRRQKPLLDKKLAEQGMMLLYAVPGRRRASTARSRSASAADLKGIKWRAYSPATAASPNWWARSRSPCRPPS